MTGWEKQWQDPETRKLWEESPPLPEVITMADRLAAEGRERVLDIGCGPGRHTVYLAARGFQVTATDNSPTAIGLCKENLAKAGVCANLIEADMTEFPFEDGYFDGVIAAHVIHHTDRATLARIIGLVTRRLAPQGMFFWATPTTRHCYYGHGQEIEPNTWVHPEHDGGIPHHYCTEQEARELLCDYEVESLSEHEYRKAENLYAQWHILARKR